MKTVLPLDAASKTECEQFMKITINEIAKAANVAKSTVSKVINNSPTISEATRNKVLQIMKDMNFIPDSAATQLAKRASLMVGLVIDIDRKDDFLNPFFYSIIGGVESVMGLHQYDLAISNIRSQGSSTRMDLLRRFVYNNRMDGLILHTLTAEQSLIDELERLGFPYAVIGRPVAEGVIAWTDGDNETGGEMAVRHLLDQGYSRIGFIGGDFGEPLAQSRLRGYNRVMNGEGERLSYCLPGPSDENGGYRMMQSLLALPEPPDAAVCINNLVAFGALKALQEAEIAVPRDFGLVTFDDYPIAPYTTPALTCLDIDTFEIGVRAAHLLLEKMGDPAKPIPPQLLAPKLIVRGSSLKRAEF
jgi:DNA-binding LacI/PurR family transcriptional regulator